MLFTHVVPPFRKASLSFTCIVQPPPCPDGKFTTAASYGGSIVAVPCSFTAAPLWVARSHIRSFLPSVSYGGSPPSLQRGQVCHTALLHFLPQAQFRFFISIFSYSNNGLYTLGFIFQYIIK